MTAIPITEAQLKRQVGDYLQYKTNLGELYADRLNSGAIYEKRGDKTYGVKLCREGTSDFMVFRTVYIGGVYFLELIFLEIKSAKGKQSPEQGAFQKLVETQGASYHIVRSIDELQNILET